MQPQSATKLRTPAQLQPVYQEEAALPAGYRAKKAFHLGHFPHNWAWLSAEHGFLPVLSEIAAVPGANGVRRQSPHILNGPVRVANANAGAIIMTGAITGFTSKGGTYIDPNDARLGEYQHYDRHYYPVRGGGRHYCMPWESATILPTGRVIWDDEAAAEGSIRFRRHLIEAGIVGEMDDTVYLDLRSKLEHKRDGILSRAGAAADTDYIKRKIAAIDATLAGMAETWEARVERDIQAGAGKALRPKRADRSAALSKE